MYKYLLLSALLFTALHVQAQKADTTNYGIVYTTPLGIRVGIHYLKAGWVITDTMALINELERRLEEAYKEREDAEAKYKEEREINIQLRRKLKLYTDGTAI